MAKYRNQKGKDQADQQKLLTESLLEFSRFEAYYGRLMLTYSENLIRLDETLTEIEGTAKAMETLSQRNNSGTAPNKS